MTYIIIITLCIIIALILFYILNVDLKKIKELDNNNKLNEIVKSFPSNIEICKDILKKLNNSNVCIEEKDDSNSFYLVFKNKIEIGKISNKFTRVQIIAHECIHSIQSRKMLVFNNIFSNINNIYYILIIILTFCGVINNYILQISIIILLGFVFYIIRNLLEMEALIKSKYVAKEYIEENKLCSKIELEEILYNYNELNKIGIPTMNYIFFISTIIKIMLYSIIAIILS